MHDTISEYFLESSRLSREMSALSGKVAEVADVLMAKLKKGGQVLVCGNGGSASQASHLVGEFVGKFARKRPGIPCISLSSDNAFTTAWANDFEYESIFERALSTYAKRDDVLIALSTSGDSRNVVRALRKAREMGVASVALVGRDGGAICRDRLAEFSVVVPHDEAARIQEIHLMIIHVLCKLVEDGIYGSNTH